MTIAEAIVNADRLYPNSFTDEEKTVWLKKLDEKIHKELFSLYEEPSPIPSDYEAPDKNISLLIESPYDLLYLYELEGKMAYHNGDTDVYKRADIFFQTLYGAYERHYHRTHTPIAGKRFSF